MGSFAPAKIPAGKAGIFTGAPAGIRTPDTLLKRQVLCRLSYWGGLITLTDGNGANESRSDRAWQGRQDSNLRMAESKSDVLPLHHAPTSSPGSRLRFRASAKACCVHRFLLFGRDILWTRGEKQTGLGYVPIPSFVGWVKGLEPSTPGTTIRCSNQLSYTHHRENGTPEGTRTPGLLLRRQLLYPTELLAHIA